MLSGKSRPDTTIHEMYARHIHITNVVGVHGDACTEVYP